MKRVEVQCPSCSHRFELKHHRGMRALAAGVGAVIGGAITDGVIGAVVIGGASYAAARALDRYLARRCRVCGTIVPAPDEHEERAEEVQVEPA